MVPLNGLVGVTRAQCKIHETIHNPFIGCYTTYKTNDSHWGPNPQGGDLGDPIRILYKISIVNMGTCDNTHTMKRNTVQLYLY